MRATEWLAKTGRLVVIFRLLLTGCHLHLLRCAPYADAGGSAVKVAVAFGGGTVG
jgi:hypothetical protein